MEARLEKIVCLETNLDHLSGEELGQALSVLNEMPQVLDALYLPGTGKKNRPAGLLLALCRPEDEEETVLAIFRHTHTLGVRRQITERWVLARQKGTARVFGLEAPAKTYRIEGTEYARPEADAVGHAAREKGVGAPAARFGSKPWDEE